MPGDVAYPIMHKNGNREEILLIYFDGFIKNTSEGIVRTMLRDEEYWEKRYPNLSEFSEMEQDDLYENTMIFTPPDLLYALSDGTVDDDTIQEDIERILPTIFIHHSRLTSFEYALFRLMKEKFIKEVYFYREFDQGFYENEIEYVETQFSEVIEKIHFIHGGCLSAIETYHPTTLFTTDYNLVSLLYSEEAQIDDESFDMEEFMVILLNTTQTVQYHEQDGTLDYIPEFLEFMEMVNTTNKFSLAPMYNTIIETEEMNQQAREGYDDETEMEETEDEEDE